MRNHGQSYRATAAAGLGAAGNSSAALGTGVVHCDEDSFGQIRSLGVGFLGSGVVVDDAEAQCLLLLSGSAACLVCEVE